LVGGTGLYADAVTEGFVLPPESDPAIREKLSKLPLQELVSRLKKVDPEIAVKIDLKNQRRVIRALEISQLTGRPFSQLQRKKKPNLRVLKMGVQKDREEYLRRLMLELTR